MMFLFLSHLFTNSANCPQPILNLAEGGTISKNSPKPSKPSIISILPSNAPIERNQALARLDGSISVVAHWTSNPAFTHSIFSWPGIVASAGMAWNPSTPMEFLQTELDGLLDRIVIGDFRVQGSNSNAVVTLSQPVVRFKYLF